MLPESKETDLEVVTKRLFPSAGENTGVVLVPCHTWKCAPTALSSGADISEVTECHLLQQVSSQ